ncbi:hypothetical protein BDW22DRAFT_471036 [Trametopsis cervina]|nr:hypothetical protein BDW22DRAFT_471036 [Trametopsis cervina]
MDSATEGWDGMEAERPGASCQGTGTDADGRLLALPHSSFHCHRACADNRGVAWAWHGRAASGVPLREAAGARRRRRASCTGCERRYTYTGKLRKEGVNDMATRGQATSAEEGIGLAWFGRSGTCTLRCYGYGRDFEAQIFSVWCGSRLGKKSRIGKGRWDGTVNRRRRRRSSLLPPASERAEKRARVRRRAVSSRLGTLPGTDPTHTHPRTLPVCLPSLPSIASLQSSLASRPLSQSQSRYARLYATR